MKIKTLIAGIVTLCVPSSPLFAQFTEIEPNGGKTEASQAIGMMPGGTIGGSCNGTVTGLGATTQDTVDYWEIETAAQGAPGWYEWTLTMTADNTPDLKALSQTGGAVNPGSDNTALFGSATTTTPAFMVRWYSNESPSRVYITIDGSASSPANYTGTLSRVIVTPTVVAGGFAGGSITITTIGQGHSSDTDFAVADASRTIIPGAQNDDAFMFAGLQSNLNRVYAQGTYYIVISNYDLSTSNPAQADDDFQGGEVMDFPNVIVNGSSSESITLDLTIDDGNNPTQAFISKNGDWNVQFVEFTVGAGNLASYCFGNGGTAGCTACPCGNNAIASSVGGCLNSSGTSALLLASGSPTIGMDTLHFDVTGGNISTFGLLVSAPNQLPQMGACPPGSGIQSTTLDGLRCVGGGLIRHGSRTLDASGATTNGWGPPAAPAGGLSVQSGFVQGQTRNFQVFYRENNALGCGTGQASTNAINVTFL